MKRVYVVFLGVVMILSACMGLPANADAVPSPSETDAPVVPTNTEIAVPPTDGASNPKLPTAPFEAQTYINETAGFALDYPSSWTVKEEVIGDRGSQAQFLSAPELADLATLPEGETRVSATIYQWDPKNDLAAYVAHWKTAWAASGFTVLDEQQQTLELGLPAVQFTVKKPDSTVVFLVAALKDQYLVLSGEGDLDLVQEIVQRVRPISH